MTDSVLIAKNVHLTARLTAAEIWVNSDGEVGIVASQFGPNAPVPDLDAEYLDSLCSKFYYGGYTHQNAIADIMLLNGILRRSQYDEFYESLSNNLRYRRITIIASKLFQ